MEVAMSNGEQPHFGSVEELNSKYTKLASEYSKLRAQYGVLKKAVIEEKCKKEELTETLKARDTALRRAEAEMESLEFRNKQLTKRIEFLQDETNIPSSAPPGVDSPDVFSEELRLKISENERLRTSLDGIDEEYLKKISNYNFRISELESEARKFRLSDSKLVDMINGLKDEKLGQSEKIKSLENEISRLKSSSNKSPPPSDSSNYKFPLTPTDVRAQTGELLGEIWEQIQKVVASSSNFHTSWERRLQGDFPELSALLLKNGDSLKPLESAFHSLFVDGDTIAKPISTFEAYAKYFSELVPRYAIKETDRTPEYDIVMLRLDSYGFSLVEASRRVSELSHDYKSFFENIFVSVPALKITTLELFNSFISLMEAENPSSSEILKEANYCVVDALSSLLSGFEALSRILSDNFIRIGILAKSAQYDDETCSLLDIENLREKNENLLKKIAILEKELEVTEQGEEHWRPLFRRLDMKCKKPPNQEADVENTDADEVKNVYKTVLNEIVSEKLLADSKATSFYLECVSLQKRLKSSENVKKKMENEIFTIREEMEKINEEKDTTSSNYELQLSTMSELLANMNERLSSQTDEIAFLKSEMNKKVKGKK